MAAAPIPTDRVDRFRRDLLRLAGAVAERLGVAVSGGPDSLALLLLAHAAFPGQVRAATVDHGLRPQSAGEADHVARICAALGAPHRRLTVRVARAGEGLQAAAREARYAALARWSEEEGIGLLLTAHHADDQAETLLMRLNRGSGVAGLAGVRPAAGIGGLRVCRPLLGWRRDELGEIVAAAGLEAVDDPSNRDERFDRARLRRQLAEASWLQPDSLARSAALLAEAEEALEWVAERLFAARVAEQDGAPSLRAAGLPPELLRRLVLRCLRRVAPDAQPRAEPLSDLIAALQEGRTATLCGVKATGGPLWRFEAAPPRRR